ncbi:MAG: hypothetical protein ABIV26_07080, partial [Candidatus Limnocylindrales bacterium]
GPRRRCDGPRRRCDGPRRRCDDSLPTADAHRAESGRLHCTPPRLRAGDPQLVVVPLLEERPGAE